MWALFKYFVSIQLIGIDTVDIYIGWELPRLIRCVWAIPIVFILSLQLFFV